MVYLNQTHKVTQKRTKPTGKIMDNQQPAAPAPTDAPQIAPVDAAQFAPPAPSLIPPPVQGDANATLLPASEAPAEPALPPMAPEVGKVDSKLPTAASGTPMLTHEANVQPYLLVSCCGTSARTSVYARG